MEKSKVPSGKTPSAASAPAKAPPSPPSPPAPLPKLFRRIDWLTFAITVVVVFIGYFLTLAPDLTLEDSGELATASMYAGIPHPPGYPVWTIYTWFFAKFLPFSNIAWRVAFGEAVSGAIACGVLALMVSRGSGMMLEGITAIKGLNRQWENAICAVSGFVAGALLGFNGFMWSQSIIVEVYSFGVLSLMATLCFLMRWVYAPHQRWYLYLAFFAFGVCFTNHQTLILAAMGLEVAILVVDLRIGRDLMLGNSIIYLVGLLLKQQHVLTSFDTNKSLFLIYNIVGVFSLIAFIVLLALTMKTLDDWLALARDFVLVLFTGYVLVMVGLATEILPKLDNKSSLFILLHLVGLGALGILIWLVEISPKREELRSFRPFYLPALGIGLLLLFTLIVVSAGGFRWLKGDLTRFWVFMFSGLITFSLCLWLTSRRREVGSEVKVVLMLGIMWLLGAGFYLYMPIAGMSCPPLQWGYPRTVEGFFHALTRGQYEGTHPVDVFKDPLKFLDQILIMVEGVGAEFNWAYTLIALVPFFFFLRLQKRERCWLVGLTAIYLFMGILLVVLLNPARDKQSLDLNRVFFTATHAIVAMFIGYGIALLAGSLLAARESAWRWLPLATLGLAVAALHAPISVIYERYGADVPTDGVQLLILAPIWLAIAFFLWRRSEGMKLGPMIASITAGVVGMLFVCFGAKFFFGWTFGRKPEVPHVTPNIAKCIGVLVDGFKQDLSHGDPTLTLWGALLVVVLVIAALAVVWTGRKDLRLGSFLLIIALMPFYSVLSNWFENEQRGHLFGYWFGHDMFTPPFVAEGTGQFSYDPKLREQAMKGKDGKYVYPEMTRNAVLFGGTDPGRFCPTYMIFCESFIPARCKPRDPNFDRRDVYIITQNALADGTYLAYIRSQFFRSAQVDPPFFKELLRPTAERKVGYKTNFVARLAYNVLDVPFTKLGEKIEKQRRRDGVYPADEIYTPSEDDSTHCFHDYMEDAQRRIMHDQQFPNEPPQLKQGEEVRIVDQRVQVSGQVAVMAINGLLTKVIFDQNPTNEFFVEESFPLDWMYPNLTPFGIIMKINRQPLAELSDEVLERDHEFWAKYSERLIGNWITYDTTLDQIGEFIERVHMRHDFTGFAGDRKFIRDKQSQKAFSKLRSSIAGIYSWRLGVPGTSPIVPQYVLRDDTQRQRMIREAEFAYRQAFAFCPYSPEAVFRYVNLLLYVGRIDDAMRVAQIALKLDPENGGNLNLLNELNRIKNQASNNARMQQQLTQMELEVQGDPTNFSKAFELASKYLGLQQNERAMQVLDHILEQPKVDLSSVLMIADACVKLRDMARLERVLQKLTTLAPTEPESWYDLASCRLTLNKQAEALSAFKRALELNAQRLAKNPAARDIRSDAQKDPRFEPLIASPESKPFFQ